MKQDRLLVRGERAAADPDGVHKLLDRVLLDLRLLRECGRGAENKEHKKGESFGTKHGGIPSSYRDLICVVK